MNSCFKCGDIYDTDYQMHQDKDGNMICDSCWDMDYRREEEREDE